MIALDGTANKGRLGANAMLGASLAVARAAADALDLPLYRYIGGVSSASTLPVPMMNILNGGKHAENSTDLQEFMIMPLWAPIASPRPRAGAPRSTSAEEGAARKAEHQRRRRRRLRPFPGSNSEAVECWWRPSRRRATSRASRVFLALDPAASELYEDGKYHLEREGRT